MKRTRKCVKCESVDIRRVPTRPGLFGQLFLPALGFAGGGISTRLRSGVFPTHYVCGSCGYVESWIDGRDELARIKLEAASVGGHELEPFGSSTTALARSGNAHPANSDVIPETTLQQ